MYKNVLFKINIIYTNWHTLPERKLRTCAHTHIHIHSYERWKTKRREWTSTSQSLATTWRRHYADAGYSRQFTFACVTRRVWLARSVASRQGTLTIDGVFQIVVGQLNGCGDFCVKQYFLDLLKISKSSKILKPNTHTHTHLDTCVQSAQGKVKKSERIM